MRISSEAELKKLVAEGRLGAGASKQIQQALTQPTTSPKRKPASSKPRGGPSKGEAVVGIALRNAFGDWFSGGEVVTEFIPFAKRNYRADFALPRWKIVVEIDGWQFHGRNLDDHHADRERSMYFSRYNWLPFRVSHQQAVKTPGDLVDAITHVMTLRQPCERDTLDIERQPVPSGFYTRLASGHPDL